MGPQKWRRTKLSDCLEYECDCLEHATSSLLSEAVNMHKTAKFEVEFSDGQTPKMSFYPATLVQPTITDSGFCQWQMPCYNRSISRKHAVTFLKSCNSTQADNPRTRITLPVVLGCNKRRTYNVRLAQRQLLLLQEYTMTDLTYATMYTTSWHKYALKHLQVEILGAEGTQIPRKTKKAK